MVSDLDAERRLGGLSFLIARNAEIYPNRTAIHDALNGRSLTYGELYRRTAQTARALRALGVGKSDLVGYAFYNEHPSIELVFACGLIGAVAVPLNNRLSPREAGEYLDMHGCKIFLCREDLADIVSESKSVERVIRRKAGGQPDCPYETLLAVQSDEPLRPEAYWEDPYMMAMTGGTTAGSKGVMWTHGGSLLDILTVIAHLGVKRNWKTLCIAPTYHAAGLGWAFMPVFWQGGTIFFPPSPSFSPESYLETVIREKIEFVFLVPALVNRLYEVWDGTPIPTVRSLCIASAPVPEPLRRKLREMLPEADLVTGYGMTEVFSVTVQSPDEFLGIPDGVGEPALDSRVRIVDDDGNQLPFGEVGHIVARTLAMGLRYANNPDATKATFKPTSVSDSEGLEWCFTGDVGRMDENGRVTIVDRSKDVIITGGENVASAEVEAVLTRHPGVSELAVVGQPHPIWGEIVTAVVVKAEDAPADEQLAEELLEFGQQHLARYKLPKRIGFVEALPRSSFGKVLKRDLRNVELDAVFDMSARKPRPGVEGVETPKAQQFAES